LHTERALTARDDPSVSANFRETDATVRSLVRPANLALVRKEAARPSQILLGHTRIERQTAGDPVGRVNRESGACRGCPACAAVVLRRDREVLLADVAVHVLVLDADIGEVDVPVEVRRAVVPCPSLDLFRAAVRTAVAVAVAAVVLLQETLVLPFQRAVQFDAKNPRLVLLESFCGLQIGAIHLHVMRALPSAIGAYVEGLANV